MDRKLINEICKWGWARLVRAITDTGFSFAESCTQNDGRWTRVINGPAIAKEIRVFTEQLVAARELLSVSCHLFREGRFVMVLKTLQVNTVVVGVDEVLGQIRKINVDEILGQIRKINVDEILGQIRKINVDGILDQIREIKKLQKAQLVRKTFCVNTRI
jgi:hypothetical protein